MKKEASLRSDGSGRIQSESPVAFNQTTRSLSADYAINQSSNKKINFCKIGN